MWNAFRPNYLKKKKKKKKKSHEKKKKKKKKQKKKKKKKKKKKSRGKKQNKNVKGSARICAKIQDKSRKNGVDIGLWRNLDITCLNQPVYYNQDSSTIINTVYMYHH